MAQAKDVVMEAAKTAIKMAVKKAAVSAAVAIAPYAAIGCLIVVGIILGIVVICVVFVVMLYGICTYSPNTIQFLNGISGFIPDYFTTAKALSILGPVCDIFNK